MGVCEISSRICLTDSGGGGVLAATTRPLTIIALRNKNDARNRVRGLAHAVTNCSGSQKGALAEIAARFGAELATGVVLRIVTIHRPHCYL